MIFNNKKIELTGYCTTLRMREQKMENNENKYIREIGEP